MANAGKSLHKLSTQAQWIISEWWHLKSLSSNAKAPGNKLLLSSQHAEPRVRAVDGQHLHIHFIKLAFLTELQLKNAVKTEGIYSTPSFDVKKKKTLLQAEERF